MTWRKNISDEATEYQNTEDNGSVWRAFKFKQNQITVTVSPYIAVRIKAFMAPHKISIESSNVNQNTVLNVSTDKQLFCGKLLEFCAIHDHDTAYELNTGVIQELKQASVTVQYLENFEARLRALELGVQYQNLPVAKEFRAPLRFSFIARPPVTKDNLVASGINDFDAKGLTTLHHTIAELTKKHYNNSEDTQREHEHVTLNKLAELIRQGANPDLQCRAKDMNYTVDGCGMGLHGSKSSLHMLFDMCTLSKSVNSANVILSATQILLAAGANPNCLSVAEMQGAFSAVTDNQNKVRRSAMAHFLALLLHHGAPTLELQGLSPIKQIGITTRVLNAYNFMRRQMFIEAVNSNPKLHTFVGIDNEMPIHGFGAVDNLTDIGVESRGERAKIDSAIQIQKVLRGHLSRTTRQQRTELIEARSIRPKIKG